MQRITAPPRWPTTLLGIIMKLTAALGGLCMEILCYALLALCSWGLLGGWELHDCEHSSTVYRGWLAPPVCLAYLFPLIIPFSVYVIIARWTGEKLYRHA